MTTPEEQAAMGHGGLAAMAVGENAIARATKK